MIKRILCLSLLAVSIGFTSCEKEQVSEQPVSEVAKEGPDVPNHIRKKVADLNFNSKHIVKNDMLLPDGSFLENYLIEGDIAMSEEQMSTMSSKPITDKQYRTYNLVNTPRTVNVIGYTGGSQALTTKQRTALQWSIDNYNALNLGITFTLTFGTNYAPYDIVVYQNKNGQAGGVAGFPSSGNPYKYVQIFSGMEAYSTNTNEHVITHEIGHSVGLRHTDWFSRQSCGQSGESANPDGAVHIPGTPTGYDSTSVMLACFGANEDGEFGPNDEVALNYLY
ncbi:dual-action HEIGH metallo-peptidase [Christiangramia gaetbulicola]|uniref:Dual-action HEIGH metallo-peptidase n=1 Tax=Christiangramia gaetbulicola TaxID=703340 RepID=A0A2T6AK39_9FLAO|nr:M57 family metalloprotease [Christiangramia gaetbulicola]PTX44180.1 dual-action HEIGH metallo-peptidase [Christiangramia gaetbulicola]